MGTAILWSSFYQLFSPGHPRLAIGVSDCPHLYVCFESQCRIFGLFNYHESACSGPLKTNYINSGPCIHEEDGTLWDNGLEDLLALWGPDELCALVCKSYKRFLKVPVVLVVGLVVIG